MSKFMRFPDESEEASTEIFVLSNDDNNCEYVNPWFLVDDNDYYPL